VSLLVLDTSAKVAFAAGSIHVGEPISEVRDEGGRVVVPVVCLAEAARQVGDEMLHVLVKNSVNLQFGSIATIIPADPDPP
jgi:hypothetical protein